MTDYKGEQITPEQIEGIRRFDSNDVQGPRLNRNFSYVTQVLLDDEVQGNEKFQDYENLLPSQIHSEFGLSTLSIGDTVSFSKQWAGGIDYKQVSADFIVRKIHKEVEQNVCSFRLFTTIFVVPSEYRKEKIAELVGARTSSLKSIPTLDIEIK